MISAATEDTITSILRDELEALGVNTKLIPIIDTPVGVRKPDLLCRNGGIYPIEAKFKEKDLLDAIKKVQNDYLKHHKVIGVKGGFAVLYPKELSRKVAHFDVRGLVLKSRFKLVAMFPDEDKRGFNVYEGSLPEITQILADYILNPLEEVEPSIDYIIKALRESTMGLLEGLAHLKGEELEGFFGGKNVFENILQYGKDEYPLEELRYAAAYLLMNQLLFYQVLSKIRPEFPEIDPDALRRPSDLNQYFEKVTEVNYKVIYSYDVTSLIPQTFLEQVKTIINIISGLGPQKVGGDLLGTIFHDLIPFEIRKKVAAFYTNVLAAELLASLSIDREDAKVADLAVGSGGLLVAAYRRKKTLLERPLSQEDHRRFVEDELLGVDVMPFATNVAACQLALQSPKYFTDKVGMAVWDSTDLTPGITIPSIADLEKRLTGQTRIDTFGPPETEDKGVVRLSGNPDDIKLQKYDVVIMNPPFTRQERLPKEYKDLLSTRFKEYKDYLHGQLGYYGYFILLADRFLKQKGRIAFVLPATILRIRSAQGIRNLLDENYDFEHIITAYQRAAFSEAAQFREILLIARKNPSLTGKLCTVTFLKKLPKDMLEARATSAKILEVKEKLGEGEIYDSAEFSSRNIGQLELRKHIGNLFKLIACRDFKLLDIWDKIQKDNHETLEPFSESLKKIGGNIEEGARARSHLMRAPIGSMYVLFSESRASKKEDKWIIKEITDKTIIVENMIDSRTINIPLSSLKPGLRRLSGVNSVDISNKLDYILVKKFPKIRDLFIFENVDDILLDLPKWREYVTNRLSKMALAFRFDMSSKGTSLFAWYSATPMVGCGVVWNITGLSDDLAKILTLWFNSTLNALQIFINRVETRGAWMQFHKYVMNDLLVPDITNLQDHQRETLLKTFEEIKNVEFPSFVEQLKDRNPSRRLIDETWLEILGYEGDVNELLDGLYESLADEIGLLKTLMAEGD